MFLINCIHSVKHNLNYLHSPLFNSSYLFMGENATLELKSRYLAFTYYCQKVNYTFIYQFFQLKYQCYF